MYKNNKTLKGATKMTRNEASIIKHLAEEIYRKDERLTRVKEIIKQEYDNTLSAYQYTEALRYKYQLDELQIIALKLGLIKRSIHELKE